MKFTDLIDFRVFIFSLCVGLFFSYITSPPLEVILVYPNPDNEHKLLYKDKSGLCQRYNSKEVDCPTDTSKIRKYPLQGQKKSKNNNTS